MKIDFLEAANGAALCKTHTADSAGNVTTDPYPFVKFFNSHREEVNTTQELYDALQKHAALGRCALKGLLAKSLSNEERKGQTTTLDPTEWICLDLDFDSGFADIQSFVSQLGPAFAQASYVFQHSNSAGIKGQAGLRGHLYFQLSAPTSPKVLKEWLRELNLVNPVLRSMTTLAKNGHSLIWPLDISTCQNDKLIFIAPPTLINISAPVSNYFSMHHGSTDSVSFTPAPNPSKNTADTETRIRELRAQAGLPNVKARHKKYGSEIVLDNPDPMVITEAREQGDYVRVNIMGDNPSWGYYYNKNAPDLLYNFKGAPLVRIADIDPSFAASIAQSTPQANEPTTGNRIPVVFRDFATDGYYNGYYDVASDTLEMHSTSSKAKIQDFLKENNIDPIETVPDYTYAFDPTSLRVIDFKRHWANKFSPSELIRTCTPMGGIPIPPTVDKILRSITVDGQTYEHFINWLAYIFQTRCKTATAWLFSGVEGTGKGLLASKILEPIFGSDYVTRITTENLDDLFNAQFEESIFLFIDEFNIDNARDADKIHNKLKNLITEERINVRKMRQNAETLPSFMNIIMATNTNTALPLTANDRRFNIAPPQTTPISISNAEVLQITNELPEFTSFLGGYNVDRVQAHSIIQNSARQRHIDRSETSVDQFFNAVKANNIQFFLDFCPSSDNTGFDRQAEVYRQIIESWVSDNPSFIPADELRECYNFLHSARISSHKFRTMGRHRGLDLVRGPLPSGNNGLGVQVNFPKVDPSTYKVQQPNNIVPIK
jgi:hypothetical protein